MANLESLAYVNDPAAKALLTGSGEPHDFRVAKLQPIENYVGADSAGSPYLQASSIVDTFLGSQFDGETHRKLTPFVQRMYDRNQAVFMRQIDSAAEECTRDIRDGYYERRFDVVIVGSGPHGAAVACYLRQVYPALSTLIIEKGKLGGQFRSYGDKAVFQMNSRVRKPNRLLDPIPRTPANINPLGRYAVVELSDIAMGQYAWNNEMGDVCAINAYLSATRVMVGATVTSITNGTDLVVNLDGYGDIEISAKQTVDATGLAQTTQLLSSAHDGFRSFDFARQAGRYFDTADLYRHFATSAEPMAAFAGKTVMVIGSGDSAFTCLEALLGALPGTTYGKMGFARGKPASIRWFGAKGNDRKSIAKCLRSRYQNGIVQALPRDAGDEGALIQPDKRRAYGIQIGNGSYGSYSTAGMTVEVGTKQDRQRFNLEDVQVDVVIDCTNERQERSRFNPQWQPSEVVGPAAGERALPYSTQLAVENLGIKENTAALWATMSQTDSAAQRAGGTATLRKSGDS